MPYIKNEDRNKLVNNSAKNPGELNYKISQLLIEYLNDKGLCYKTINDILGALTGAQLEFYRRIAAPYEDIKKEENGDVYE